MSKLTLVVGNKNLSSWSLRPYLALAQSGAEFDEVVIYLDQPETAAQIAKWSPGGKVPVLKDGDLTVWESLAICEYIADRFPEAKLWPADRAARAIARAVSSEMHAGFAELRKTCTMKIAEKRPTPELTPALRKDIDRITAMWTGLRQQYGQGGPFLFGHFTIADAMYAPVVARFETYGIPVEKAVRQYMDAVFALPAMRRWIDGAKKEIAAGVKHSH